MAELPVDKRFADPVSPAGAGRQPGRRGPHLVGLAPFRLPAGGPACSGPIREKRFVSLAREAAHARLHPSSAVERCTAALHAEWMSAESHRSGRGGTHVSAIDRIGQRSALKRLGSRPKPCVRNRPARRGSLSAGVVLAIRLRAARLAWRTVRRRRRGGGTLLRRLRGGLLLPRVWRRRLRGACGRGRSASRR